MNINCQMWEPLATLGAFHEYKELKLKLNLETRNRGEVVIVHCQGRLVYRDEAAALSCVVDEVLHEGSRVILELSGVTAMDSAGIGELALLQTWAKDRNAELKCSGANSMVRTLLDLTNLDSVIELYPTLDAAVDSFPAKMCVDC